MFGPPGTGKTSGFVAVTDELVSLRLLASLRDMVGAHLGDTEKSVRELTNFIAAHAHDEKPPALLLDDGDDFLSGRSNDPSAAGQTLNGMKVAMLSILDHAGNVPVVITTNRVKSLDSAIHRRIVEHVEFPLPDQGARFELLGRLVSLAKLGNTLDSEAIARLAEEAEGLSPAEMEHTVVQAALDLGCGVAVDEVVAVREGILTRKRMGERIHERDKLSRAFTRDDELPKWPGMT